MTGHILFRLHPARVVEQPHHQQLRDRVHQAGSADPLRRNVAADHLQLDRLAQVHALDRPIGRPHPAPDLAAFECRPRRRGCRQRPLGAAQHDLAVRAHVDEDAQLVLAHDTRRKHAGDDVGSDIGAEGRQRLNVAARMDVQADLARDDIQRFHERGSEGHHGERARIDPKQQVKHRGVADDDRLVRPLGRHAGLAVERGHDAVHGRDDRRLQLADLVRPVHAVADARDHVRAEGCLSVERREDRGRHSSAQVHQRADHCGRADVEGDAEALAGRVARLERDEILARQNGSDSKLGFAHHRGNRAHHRDSRDHVMTLFGQRVLQAHHVAALIGERRLGQLEKDLAHVRVEDDQAAEPHGGRLRHPQQLRHLAHHVLVDPCLAREPPAFFDLHRPKQSMVGSFGIRPALDHADLALPARAAAAAGRIDGQADPMRGAEQRRAWRDSRDTVEREVADLELALDHFSPNAPCARPAALSSAR